MLLNVAVLSLGRIWTMYQTVLLRHCSVMSHYNWSTCFADIFDVLQHIDIQLDQYIGRY